MNVFAPRAVRTGPSAHECAARLGLVFGMPLPVPQLLLAVRELALGSVAARPRLLPAVTQLGLHQHQNRIDSPKPKIPKLAKNMTRADFI